MACELYCCLLPQCEALRTCHSGFPIATPLILFPNIAKNLYYWSVSVFCVATVCLQQDNTLC